MVDELLSQSAGRLAVLLVDPVSVEAAALIHDLTANGFEYTAVGRWTALIEEVVGRAPDVVVMDLAMAGMAGSRLIGMVRAASPNTRVVAVTDFDLVDVAALESGATVVVSPQDLRPFAALLIQLVSAEVALPGPVEG